MKKFYSHRALIYFFLLFLFCFNGLIYSVDADNGETVEKIRTKSGNSERTPRKPKMTFPFGFNISALSKIELGEGSEFVYDAGKKLSELKWHLKPAGGFGFNAELFLNTGFHAFFSSSFFLKAFSGKMIDMDFTLKEYADKPTHKSEHQNLLKNGYHIEFYLGWVMPVAEYILKNSETVVISVEPLAGAYFFKHTWLASMGYIQYSGKGNYVTEDVPKVQQLEDVIQYMQTIIVPNIGFALIFDLPRAWKLRTSIRGCPQVKAYCKDEHFLRLPPITFYDTFEKKGFAFHFNFLVEKNISQVVKVFSRFDYSTVFSKFGKTKSVEFNNDKAPGFAPEGASGTKLDSVSFDVGVGIGIPQGYK